MEPRGRDQFEDLLDGALKQYGNVEPRPGLEGRVLARLAAEACRSHSRTWWVWGLAGAAAMIVVIGMWIGIGYRRPATAAATVQPRVSETAAQKTAVVTPPIELNKPILKRVRSGETSATVAKDTEPRLEQFPSPRPLTRQELVAAEYVEQFPEEAKLILQEQQKFDEEVQKAQEQVENSRNSDNLER